MTPEDAGRRTGRIEQDAVEQALARSRGGFPAQGIARHQRRRQPDPRQILAHPVEPGIGHIDRRHLGAQRRELQRLATRRRAQIKHPIARLHAHQPYRQRGGKVLHPPGAFSKARPFGDRAAQRLAARHPDMARKQRYAAQRLRPFFGFGRVLAGQVGCRFIGERLRCRLRHIRPPLHRPADGEQVGQMRHIGQGCIAAHQIAEHAMHQPARAAFDQRQRGRDSGVLRGAKLQPAGERDAQHHPRPCIIGQRLGGCRIDQRIEIGQPAQHGRRQVARQRPVGTQRDAVERRFERQLERRATAEHRHQQAQGAFARRDALCGLHRLFALHPGFETSDFRLQ